MVKLVRMRTIKLTGRGSFEPLFRESFPEQQSDLIDQQSSDTCRSQDPVCPNPFHQDPLSPSLSLTPRVLIVELFFEVAFDG